MLARRRMFFSFTDPMNLNHTIQDLTEVRIPPAPLPVASFDPAEQRLLTRPVVHGKFLSCGDQKMYVRGVTYGGFRPRRNGEEFPDPQVVEYDFLQMRANGINAVRTYTVPPA